MSSRWLRASLAVLLLAFTLNLTAHAAHWHDDAKATQAAHSTNCGYCAAFGSVADAPANRGAFAPPISTIEHFLPPSVGIIGWRVQTAARPRAPPVS